MEKLKTSIKINGRSIGPTHPPYFVAEMAGNHQQCIEQANALIKAARDGGADAINIQTYTADTLTLPIRTEQFRAKGPWENTYLYDLFRTNATPWEWHEDLAHYAKRLNMTLFSTPFDETAVDFAEETLKPPLYKISSFEITHIPLLKKVASTEKPVVLGTGLASEEDVALAVQTLTENGCPAIILLKCVRAYSNNTARFNLRSIDTLKKYTSLVGISDHSLSSSVIMGAIAMGACFVEKHLVLSRKSDAADAPFALEPMEFLHMVQEGKSLYESLGESTIALTEEEEEQKRFRRSIYVSRPIQKGEKLTKNNLKVIRPSFGLHPRYWEQVLGQTAQSDMPAGHPLSSKDVDLGKAACGTKKTKSSSGTKAGSVKKPKRQTKKA